MYIWGRLFKIGWHYSPDGDFLKLPKASVDGSYPYHQLYSFSAFLRIGRRIAIQWIPLSNIRTTGPRALQLCSQLIFA